MSSKHPLEAPEVKQFKSITHSQFTIQRLSVVCRCQMKPMLNVVSRFKPRTVTVLGTMFGNSSSSACKSHVIGVKASRAFFWTSHRHPTQLLRLLTPASVFHIILIKLSHQQTRPIAHVLEPLNALGNLFGNVSKWSQAGSEGCLGEDLGGVRPSSATSMALFKNVDFPYVLLRFWSVTCAWLFKNVDFP